MGRIHRDIKPSNILMARDGRAKISDFGVAKIVAEPYTVSGQILGTPLYMSPEQVKDEPIDGRSDLFSLGVVLYQCVTGQLPFAGDSLAKVVYKILHTDPHPPTVGALRGGHDVARGHGAVPDERPRGALPDRSGLLRGAGPGHPGLCRRGGGGDFFTAGRSDANPGYSGNRVAKHHRRRLLCRHRPHLATQHR